MVLLIGFGEKKKFKLWSIAFDCFIYILENSLLEADYELYEI